MDACASGSFAGVSQGTKGEKLLTHKTLLAKILLLIGETGASNEVKARWRL